ncbi:MULTISPECIES: hypothetical protein [Spirosoma]|uniref:Uncharacterized protein n=1 Tax=Spirosoma sordidisoli TaxID=2502893 RepID=A0A4Q2UUG2_9BACT|nr:MULTISPECIES: hypothetical protein [Spirosoma]RYC71440.1 hypothetical protein EQG79_04675 [Spirosoma sordidisoli]
MIKKTAQTSGFFVGPFPNPAEQPARFCRLLPDDRRFDANWQTGKIVRLPTLTGHQHKHVREWQLSGRETSHSLTCLRNALRG